MINATYAKINKYLKNETESKGLPKTIIVSVFIWSGGVVKSIFRLRPVDKRL